MWNRGEITVSTAVFRILSVHFFTPPMLLPCYDPIFHPGILGHSADFPSEDKSPKRGSVSTMMLIYSEHNFIVMNRGRFRQVFFKKIVQPTFVQQHFYMMWRSNR